MSPDLLSLQSCTRLLILPHPLMLQVTVLLLSPSTYDTRVQALLSNTLEVIHFDIKLLAGRAPLDGGILIHLHHSCHILGGLPEDLQPLRLLWHDLIHLLLNATNHLLKLGLGLIPHRLIPQEALLGHVVEGSIQPCDMPIEHLCQTS